MKNTRRTLLASAGAALLAAALGTGCASRPEVRHLQDPATDLAQYRSFAFFEPARPGAFSDPAGMRLRQAVREQMEQRGYRFDETAPELRVNVVVTLVEHPEIRSAPGTRGPWMYRGGDIETISVRDGTLVIDLVDMERRALVWRGMAEGRVESAALRDPGTLLADAVREVFAVLPGRAGASLAKR